MKKSTLYVVIMTIIFIIVAIPTNIFASGNENNEIKLTIIPGDSLFDIDDMKPGDWAPRSITVQNEGEMDFQYGVTMENNGSEKLFNEILLEVHNNDKELYHGKLANFDSLPLRELSVRSSEDLDFTIRFPEHLGNEYQGLDVHFSLLFTAEGKLGKTEEVTIDSKLGSDDVQKSGLTLPSTATNIFTLMLIGVGLLISGGLLVIIKKKRAGKQS